MRAKYTRLKSGQRGMATLVVSLLILFLITLVTLYAANTTILEQKVSGQQYRTDQAVAAADAGLEWGLAYFDGGLDRDGDDQADCIATDRCIHDLDEGLADIFSDSYSGPRVEVFFCASKPVGEAGSVFLVDAVEDVCDEPNLTGDNDPDDVGIVAIGYSDDRSAVRIVKQELGSLTFFGDGPKSSVSTISMVQLGGNVNVVNRYHNITVWSGDRVIDFGNSNTYLRNPDLEVSELTEEQLACSVSSNQGVCADFEDFTIFGSGTNAATGWDEANLDIVDSDVNLQNLKDDPDALFSLFFNGKTKDQFKRMAESMTQVFDNGQAFTETQFNALSNAEKANLSGYVYIDGTDINIGDLGTVDAPVILFVEGSVAMSGNSEFHGFVYCGAGNGEDGQMSFNGGAVAYGAVAAEGQVGQMGGGTVEFIYDPRAFSLENVPKVGARVSGTWKDW